MQFAKFKKACKKNIVFDSPLLLLCPYEPRASLNVGCQNVQPAEEKKTYNKREEHHICKKKNKLQIQAMELNIN